MRRRINTWTALAAVAGLIVAGINMTPAAADSAHDAGKAAKPASPTARPAPKPAPIAVPQGDELISSTADPDGYHLFAASAGDSWAWHPLATLQPSGYSDEPWTGQYCLTGDGKWVVAVVAPWHAQNSGDGLARGGFAYAVDAHTGAVKPLLSQVSLAYFNPGCGAGDQVALTRFVNADDSVTQIALADPSTGKSQLMATVDGEITAAVPGLSGVVAARGNQLVRFAGAQETSVAALPGTVFSIHPDAAGGVDLLSQLDAHTVRAYNYHSGRVTAEASGGLQRMHLYPGRSGANLVTGADSVTTGSRLRQVDDGGATPESVSLAGAAILRPTTKTAALPAGATATPETAKTPTSATATSATAATAKPTAASNAPTPNTTATTTATNAAATLKPTRVGNGPWTLRQESLPAATAPVNTALPTGTPANVAATGHAANTPAASAMLGPDVAATDPWKDPAAQYTSPRCAVPRDDPHYQAMQPSTVQIGWAAARAVTGSLTTTRTGAPNGLAAYKPSTDFPKPSLAGNAGVNIPVNIIEGILAQESNWDQASWHAPRGSTGDPLTGDYYGLSGDGMLNYDLADCGYGLGQLTSLMNLPAPGASPTLQQKAIAVDYQENVAATVAGLGAKWNELYNKNIKLGNSNANYIENWYFAIWAYNSGLQPNAANDNTTGCDPGPSCNDGLGNWGLGYSNNPANDAYDPQRAPFLRNTYDDAKTPGKWPYQEKVFGWMETPLRSGDSNIYYGATSRLLTLPGFGQFCTVVDLCAYNSTTTPGNCQNDEYHCWWHMPASYVTCTAASCVTGTALNAGATEPANATNLAPGVCDLNTNTVLPGDMQHVPIADTVVVDDESGTGSLMSPSCSASGRNWSMRGTFTPGFSLDTRSSEIGRVDWHQISGGFGGHTFFTHTAPRGNGADYGVWDPQLTLGGYYEVRAFIPNIAAVTKQADYTIKNVLNAEGDEVWVDRYVNQNAVGDQWVDLGFYRLAPGATVSLTAETDDGKYLDDIAFDAMAFIHINSLSYVSLGDSYSSGEGSNAPPFENSSNIAPMGILPYGDSCDRNINSYARQYALQTVQLADRPVVQLACSGSDIDDVLGDYGGNITGNNPDGAGNAHSGEPFQLDQIPGDPALVTLTIGGNDAGFVDVMARCVTIDTASLGTQQCKPTFIDSQGHDTLAAKVTGLAPRLATVYAAVRARAPYARIVVLTYPQIFQVNLTSDGTLDCSGIGNADRRWLTGITNQLDDEIVAQAHAAGLDVLDERGAFVGHQLCTDPTPSYVVRPNDIWLNGSDHPNALGYAREAADLKAYLAAHGISF